MRDREDDSVATVMLSGVGELGGWALEFLARSPGVDRIVSLKRSPWTGPSLSTLALLGSWFQGHSKRFEHHQVDLADTDTVAALLVEVRPAVVIHSATVQTPRRLMGASLDPAVRATLREATFSMWLPWQLLPASRLTEAVEKAGVDTHVVNACFPDVVNPALWSRYGHGPMAGAGNVEVCAARIERYLMDVLDADPRDIEVSLIGSHALLAYGPDRGVPYHVHVRVRGEDVTSDHDIASVLSAWPERIDWSLVDVFSLFAASAVKNALALAGEAEIRTHVTAPKGLPGGYPAFIGDGQVRLDLPSSIDEAEAVALNRNAARWDGVERVETDGTVVYTDAAAGAMAELGCREGPVTFADLPARSDELRSIYLKMTRTESDTDG